MTHFQNGETREKRAGLPARPARLTRPARLARPAPVGREGPGTGGNRNGAHPGGAAFLPGFWLIWPAPAARGQKAGTFELRDRPAAESTLKIAPAPGLLEPALARLPRAGPAMRREIERQLGWVAAQQARENAGRSVGRAAQMSPASTTSQAAPAAIAVIATAAEARSLAWRASSCGSVEM